ncbi:MAG: 50S ribosomal protein L4 [bacterium]
MEIKVKKIDGKKSGKSVEFPDNLLEITPNDHAVYLAVKAQSTNSRQGTAATKTRSMVAGGGKKPWRQKGRGVARAGTTRSPLWVGGGRVFGPHPREYKMQLPRKVKKLARQSVLVDRIKNDRVSVIEDFKLQNAKTKEMYAILMALDLADKKTLLLIKEHDAVLLRAGRNIPKLQIKVAATESTYDLLNCEHLLIQAGAVEKIAGVFET